MTGDYKSIEDQFVFYGSYHSNKINIAVHLIFVPVLLWSGLAWGVGIPTPSFFPNLDYHINDYLMFKFNWATLYAGLSLIYYIYLEPFAGLTYAPQMIFMFLNSQVLGSKPGGIKTAVAIHVVSWIAQILAHVLAEGRAPALTDNFIGTILAPLFVHSELLFALRWNPELHKRVQRQVGIEVAKFRRAKAQKQREEKGKIATK